MWNQSTSSKAFNETFSHANWLYGPSIKWTIYNSTTGKVIGLNESIGIGSWADYVLEIPKNSLQGKIPYAIAFVGMELDFGVSSKPMANAGTSMFLALYIVADGRWFIYSSQNATGIGGEQGGPPPPPGPGPDLPPDWTPADMFGTPLNPFMEMNLNASGWFIGPDKYYTQFNLKFNSSTKPATYSFHAVALDSALSTLAESREDEFSFRVVGMSLKDAIYMIAGGSYSYSRLDDDGNILYSATRGQDFNMTFTIDSPNPGNVTIMMDLPQKIRTTHMVEGPYMEVRQTVGGWNWDPVEKYYYWDPLLLVNYTVERFGLHNVTEEVFFDPVMPYQYYDPIKDKWVDDNAWGREAIIYWFSNNSFAIRLAYSLNRYEYVNNSFHEGWELRSYWVYSSFPTDGSVPQPYFLNMTGTYHSLVNGLHVVNFRGHIGTEIPPTGAENPSLNVDDRVYSLDGKFMAPDPYLPTGSEQDKNLYESLHQLAIESPISVVRLLHKGRPVESSWMFATLQNETFTLKSRLQGSSELANDIDGVMFQMNSFDERWGSENGSDWYQHSEVEIDVKIAPTGQYDVTVYNYTIRTTWKQGGHWEWKYVEIAHGSGIYEWREVWVDDYHWVDQVWSFPLNDWSTTWIPYHSNETIMPVTYLSVSNISYNIIGDELRVVFDITPNATMPDSQWDWNFYYGNLTWITDYEAGWGEHVVTDWTRQVVYSYYNGSQRVYADTPYKVYPLRNNLTDVLYATKKEPYIIINNETLLVQHYYVTTGNPEEGRYEKKIVFEEWDPTAYNPKSKDYTGNWVYYYRLLNNTKIPIKSSLHANIYNVTLANGTWFLSFSDHERYPQWAMGDGVMRLINGTFIRMPPAEWNYTATKVSSSFGEKVEPELVSMVNGTHSLYMATYPRWINDHYEFYVNGTWELIRADLRHDPVLGEKYYSYVNSTTGHIQWFYDGIWPHELYRVNYDNQTYLVADKEMEFMAYTEINGTKSQLPYPDPKPKNTPHNIQDLNTVTPFMYYAYINDTWYPVKKYAQDGHDPDRNYDYPNFYANVSGEIINMTYYTYNPSTPWLVDPYNTHDQPWGTMLNGSIPVPELNHTDWSVAYGHMNITTREFVVEGWLNVSSGYYYDDGDKAIYDVVNETQIVTTFSGSQYNYTMMTRAYFYNVTFPNGTFFYAGRPDVYLYGHYQTSGDTTYLAVEYYFMYDTNGTMKRWYEWIDLIATPVPTEEYNSSSSPEQYKFQGKWYNVTNMNMPLWDPDSENWTDNYVDNVQVETYYVLVNATATLEVIDIYDWNGATYNIPSFNFTLDGLHWYHLTGETSMIYKAHNIWGYSMKYDYAPLPITIIRNQYSIVIGTPEWGMWDLRKWDIDPSTGAIDLDGDFSTTDDQYYVREAFQSTDYYNITESYLWVSIFWEPNASVVGDEFFVESNTGMRTVNWTTDWANNYYWYNAKTGALVNSTEWKTINQTIFNAKGIPNPGYWGISWMAENFTFDDLRQQAVKEGWDWAIQNSIEWTWLWWNLHEHYGSEIVNGSTTQYVGADVWYEYAGMFAWNDTNNNDVMDLDPANIESSELTHYWIPTGADSISFTRPNASLNGDEYWPVNASVPFGVSFNNVSGTVFPFGKKSYWDWYINQYYGSDLASFNERPVKASTTDFDIGVTFTGNITGGLNNIGQVKFNMTVGDWNVTAPGGVSVLKGLSLGVGFLTQVEMFDENGTSLMPNYLDQNGQPASNQTTSQSNLFNVTAGAAAIASMNLGGQHYIWSKNASMKSTLIDSQTIPYNAFQAAFVSNTGLSATSYSVSASHFYTLINYKWWDGFKVSVDPVFVGYSSSQGVNDDKSPTIESVSTSTTFVNDVENLNVKVTANDQGGSGVQSVLVMNSDTRENTTLTYHGDTGDWQGSIAMQGTDPYTFNYTIIAIDYAYNENSTELRHHTFWNDRVKPQIGSLTVTPMGKSYVKLTVQVSDNSGGSGIKQVLVYLINTETYVSMGYNSTTGRYEATIGRTFDMEYDLQYIIYAYDNAENIESSSTLTYHFDDNLPPYLEVTRQVQNAGTDQETLLVRATVNDIGGSGLNSVKLTYTIGGSSTTVDMTFNSNTLKYEYTIPHQTKGTWVFYYVTATDGDGNIATSSEVSYQFGAIGDTPPGIGSLSISPTNPTSTDTVTVSVQIVDDSGVKNATLYYRVNNGTWTGVPMTSSGSTYSAQIPPQADGSFVEYYIVAFDTIEQSTTSVIANYTVSNADMTKPQISSIGIDKLTPTDTDTVTVSATITDNVAVANATLYYRVDSGAWTEVSMTATGNLYSAQIPAQPAGSTVEYYIRAYDTSGNYVDSQIQSYTVSQSATSTTSTQTTTTPSGAVPGGPLFNTLMILFGALAVIVVVLIVIRARK